MLFRAFLILLLSTGWAAAQTLQANPEEIAKFIQHDGYVAKIGKDSGGDPEIDSTTQGVKWVVYFYGCTNHQDCQSIQLGALFTLKNKPSLQKLNDWTEKNRYGRPFINDDGDVVLSFDVMMGKGVPEENVQATLDLWNTQLGDFLHVIGWYDQ